MFLGLLRFILVGHVTDDKWEIIVLVLSVPNQLSQDLASENKKHLVSQSFFESEIIEVI